MIGTRVSLFERSLLEPNSALLTLGQEGNIITQLILAQRSPRVFPGVERVSLVFMYCVLRIYMYLQYLVLQTQLCAPFPPHQFAPLVNKLLVKDGIAAPPAGTQVSFFERSLLEPNSARLTPSNFLSTLSGLSFQHHMARLSISIGGCGMRLVAEISGSLVLPLPKRQSLVDLTRTELLHGASFSTSSHILNKNSS